MYNQSFESIDNSAQLAELCERLTDCKVIALDTEFVRETTYYPRPALLQLHYGEQVCLIDPLSIDDFSPLINILVDPRVVKVMHSCSEDMEVFSTLFQALPVNVFDTQVACALCGLGFSLGYQKMVEVLLGHELTKTETRSNWLQRPLSKDQCQYALHDVLWLIDIYHMLTDRLAALQRESWCEEDCARICSNAAKVVVDTELYLRVKAAWRLPQEGIAVLSRLCAWREQVAREQDVPKGRIAIDATLMDIASHLPATRHALSECAQIRHTTVRRWSDELLALVAQGIKTVHDEPVLPLVSKGDRSHRELLKRLQKVTREVADQFDLPVEILGKKRDLEQYIETRNDSVIGQGWRAPLLAKKLAMVLDADTSSDAVA